MGKWDDPSTIIGSPIYEETTGTATGTFGPDLVIAGDLSNPPPGATTILIQADPDDTIVESDKTNNFMAIPWSADVQLTDLSWNSGGGVQIQGTSLNLPPKVSTITIALYWSTADQSPETGGTTSFIQDVVATPDSDGNFDIPSVAITTAPPAGSWTWLVADANYDPLANAPIAFPETNRANNWQGVIIAPVTLGLSITATDAIPPVAVHQGLATAGFSLTATVTSNAPFPLNVDFNLDEAYGASQPLEPMPTSPLATQTVALEPFGSATVVQDRFIQHQWQWIPTDGTNLLTNAESQQFAAIIKENFKQIIQDFVDNPDAALTTFSFLSASNKLLQVLREMESVVDHIDLQYTGTVGCTTVPVTSLVLFPGPSAGTFQTTLYITPTVPQPKQNYFASYIIDKVAAGTFLSASLTSLKNNPAWALALYVAYATLTTRGQSNYQAALDPPDPNFQQIVVPQVIVSSDVESLPEGPPKQLATISFQLLAFDEAEATSRDRALGAQNAGDFVWQERQLTAAAGFAAQAAAIEGDFSALSSLLVPLAETAFNDVSSDQTIAYLQSNGFPLSFSSLLRQLGYTADDIQNLLATTISNGLPAIDPADIPALLAATSLIDESNSVVDAEAAAGVRAAELQEPSSTLTATQISAFNQQQATISSELAAGIPTDALLAAIKTFILGTTEALSATNDVVDLDPVIQFGETSLAAFGALDGSPTGLQTFITTESADGLLGNTIAAALDAQLGAAQQALATGNYDAAALALNDLATYAQTNSGQGIPAGVASQLGAYASFIAGSVTPGTLSVTSAAQTLSELQNISTGSVLLATFHASNAPASLPAGFFTASVNWEDGKTESGSTSSNVSVVITGATIAVYGKHTYATGGKYVPAVTLSDPVQASIMAATTTFDIATDVTSQTAAGRGGALKNSNGTYTSTLTVTNTSSTSINGTLRFVIQGLTSTLSTVQVKIGSTVYNLTSLVTRDSLGEWVITVPSSDLAALTKGSYVLFSLTTSGVPNAYTTKTFSDPYA